MIYAAAWDATGNPAYRDRYRQYIDPAVRQSFSVEDAQPTYALLQMQCSLELLEAVEQDAARKRQIREIMAMVAKRCAARAAKADREAASLDLTAAGTDWRTGEGISTKGKYRRAWYNIRESGEAALAQLMDSAAPLPEEQRALLSRAILRIDYDRVSSNGVFYLQAAYWKARRLGVI